MLFNTSLLSGAALLALATPAFATPFPAGPTASGSFSASASGNFKAFSDRDNFCQAPSNAVTFDGAVEVGAEIQVGSIEVSSDCRCGGDATYRSRMNTPAHKVYEKALFLYQDAHHLIMKAMWKRGLERFERLIQIAAMIQRSYDYLEGAEILNDQDSRRVRHAWIQHEIRKLRRKLNDARWLALHLPNLYLACEAWNFTVDVALKVVEVIVAVPLIIGGAIAIGVIEAAHAVIRVFRFMAEVLRWAVHEVKEVFIRFRRKIRKIVRAIGHEIHKIGHEIKEGLEDFGAIIVDIGHHAFQHHPHCERQSYGVILIGEEKDECSYSEEDLCVIGVNECSRQEYVEKLHANYDIEISWDKEESIKKVTEAVVTTNEQFFATKTEFESIEHQVVKAKWTDDSNDVPTDFDEEE